MTVYNPPSRQARFDDKDQDEWARSGFQRDRDRILYSRELRRLKDVTQVARAGESYLYHDRLSHSIKVAQVGRRLAELIEQRPKNTEIDFKEVLSPDVVEAACLAHDIGHPPFGHLAEQALDEKVRAKTNPDEVDANGDNDLERWAKEEEVDPSELPVYGYEGNAQSFRIVARLAPHHRAECGLNLTRATMNAILKYPRSRDQDDNKWGYYSSEADQFEWTREGIPEGKTLEAELMDYADDVTYAIHDVADFYKGGLIPLGHLLSETERRKHAEQQLEANRKLELANEEDRAVDEIGDAETNIEEQDLPGKPTVEEFEEYIEDHDEMTLREETVEEFFQGLSQFPGVRDNLMTPFQGTDEERKTLSRLISNLVNRYLNADDEENPEFVYLADRDESEGCCLYIDRKFREQVWILKQLTFYYVINNASLIGQQQGQKQVIEELFEALYAEASKNDLNKSAIPSPYRNWLQEEDPDVDWPSPIHRRARIVADMIATMTEPQAVTLHKRLTGDTPGSLQDEIVR